MRLALALAVLVAACLSQEQLSKPRAPGNRRRKLMKLHKAGNTTKGKYCVSGLKGDFNFQSCGSFCSAEASENHCKCAHSRRHNCARRSQIHNSTALAQVLQMPRLRLLQGALQGGARGGGHQLDEGVVRQGRQDGRPHLGILAGNTKVDIPIRSASTTSHASSSAVGRRRCTRSRAARVVHREGRVC